MTALALSVSLYPAELRECCSSPVVLRALADYWEIQATMADASDMPTQWMDERKALLLAYAVHIEAFRESA